MCLGRLAETDYETLQCEISTHLLNRPGKCFAWYDKSTTPKYPMPGTMILLQNPSALEPWPVEKCAHADESLVG